jgi:hypothetical protein
LLSSGRPEPINKIAGRLNHGDGSALKKFRSVNPKRKQKRTAHLAVVSMAALIAAGDHAGARSGWSERSVESVESRSAGDPIMAIVSLRNQRITVYDAKGWILRAPVSSGQ